MYDVHTVVSYTECCVRIILFSVNSVYDVNMAVSCDECCVDMTLVFVGILQCEDVLRSVDATALLVLVVAAFVVLPNADGSNVVDCVNADGSDVVVGADDGTVDVDICVGTAAAGVIFVVDVVELNSGSDAVGAVEVGLGLILDDFVLALGSVFC